MATSTYKKLSSTTVGSGGATSITFSSIPQTYTDLVVHITSRTSGAYWVYPIINGNLTAGCWSNDIGEATSTTYTQIKSLTEANYFLLNTQTGDTTNSWAMGTVYINDYTSSINYKSILGDSTQASNTASSFLGISGALYSNPAPITSFGLYVFGGVQTFLEGTTATLYGIFNQDVSAAPSAPTIGTATDAGTNDSASVTFTGVSGAASYTITSSPGSITATGNASPIVVSGLSLGTAYTFSCTANNPFGVSGASAASNSMTLAGVASYELIGTANLSGTTTTLTGLPTSGYKHLQIFVMSQHNYTNYAGPVYLQFNGDTNSVYTWHQILSDYSQTATLTYNSTASIGYKMGTHPGTYQAGYWGTYTIDVLDFLSPNKYKSIFSNGGDGGLTYPRNWLSSGSWKNLSPINTITISTADGSFVTGSQVQVWGIR